MIKEETTTIYRLLCDRCGCEFESDDDCNVWFSDGDAIDTAEGYDWLVTDDGHHYCPECYDYDRETDICTPKPVNLKKDE